MEQLEAVYDSPVPPAALAADVDRIIPPFAKIIESSAFFILATSGPDGLDCSARGDAAGFVRVRDERTLIFPDRRGNNKIDSLRNIVQDSRVSLLFLIPGTGLILRVNGKAEISIDEVLCKSFAIGSALPKSVLIVTVEAAFMQCARAIMRSGLWDAETYPDPKSIPSMGNIISYVTKGKQGGEQFDEAAPVRMKQTLW